MQLNAIKASRWCLIWKWQSVHDFSFNRWPVDWFKWVTPLPALRVGSSSRVVYYCHIISPCVKDDVTRKDATQVGSDLLGDACRDLLWEIPVWLHYSTILRTSPREERGTLEYLKGRFDFLFTYMVVNGRRGGIEIVPAGGAWMVTKATCRVLLLYRTSWLYHWGTVWKSVLLRAPFDCDYVLTNHWSF